MRRIINTAIPLLLMSFISCHTGDKKESVYNIDRTTTQPTVQAFEINEVLKPIDMTIGDNFLCILHEEEKSGDQVFVFGADDLDFKYKFARRGSGPQEVLALDMVKKMRGDTLYLIDQAKRKVLTYLLHEDAPEFIEERHLLLPGNRGPLQETFILDDSVLVSNFIDGNLIVYNITEEKVLDQLNMTSLIRNANSEDGTKLADFNFSIDDNDIYIAFRPFDSLLNLHLDSTYTIKTQDIIPIDNPIQEADGIYDRYNYHAFVSSGKDYVLTQYYGRKLHDMQPFPFNMNGQNLKYDFILLDNELNPISCFQTNTDILRGFLDEKRHRIYYFEAFEDFDKLKYISF